MSLFFRRTSLLSVSPDVEIDALDRLVARSSPLVRVLTLFSFERTVTVDRKRQVVHLETRFLWFGRSKRAIRFDEISHLSYRYGSLWTSIGFLGVKDRVERFSVGLVLRDESEVHVFDFSGEGHGDPTGVVGVLLDGDSLVDFAGAQEAQSLSFIELLMKVTGKGLSKDRPAAHRLVPRARECAACGQSTVPSGGRCQACGARLPER
ncbi:MAG: hypothetical protein ACK6CU_11140 [Deltaproteobacteria bacterium]|jgi:hypothetical protein